jgi:hypothetical protein
MKEETKEQLINRLKKGVNKDSVKVIDYFTDDGCFSRIMKDDEYFRMVKSFSESVTVEVAASKIGIDLDDAQEISPVRLAGFKINNKSLVKKNKDGRLLSSIFEVTWLLFSNEQLYLFEKQCSLHKDRKTSEMTNEYFYKDVVSLATADMETNDSIIKDDEDYDYKVFNLTVPGDQITVALDPTDETEAAIQGMKQKVREKKQGD